MIEIERTPPTSPVHRNLWAMGFDKGERNEIIAAAKGIYGADPVSLAELIIRMRPSLIEKPEVGRETNRGLNNL